MNAPSLLAEWLTRAPVLEEDVALANISLDLLGQARGLYKAVAILDGTGRDEDSYVYWRDSRQWRSVHLVQLVTDDFGVEMARLLWMSALLSHRYADLAHLADQRDDPGPVHIGGVSGKAVKEVAYHLDHADLWVRRLGDGTPESHDRMTSGLAVVAPYVAELFDDHPSDQAAHESWGVALPSTHRGRVTARVERTVTAATLETPVSPVWRSRGGREGRQTEGFDLMLAEMQQVARAHPGASW